MSNENLEKPDTYLKDVSSAVAAAIGNVIGQQFVLTQFIEELADDGTENRMRPGARVVSTKHQGELYDLVSKKEKGPSRTIRMVLRQR